MAATTEAQPLTAQAQATSAGAAALSRARTSGNGIPIAKAKGAISAMARRKRDIVESPAVNVSSLGPAKV